MPSNRVAEQVERGFDRDRIRLNLQEVVGGRELAIDLAGTLDVAATRGTHLLCDLRAHDVRVHADAADAAELEKRLDQVVIAGIEVEAGGNDVSGLGEIVVRLLDGANGRDLGEPRDRLWLDIDHDASGDVVDDDR